MALCDFFTGAPSEECINLNSPMADTEATANQ